MHDILGDFNAFHDWSVEGIVIVDQTLELHLAFDGKKRTIKFDGVSRCQLNDFLIQNIIYELKILNKDISTDGYKTELDLLPALPYSGSKSQKNLARITSSVGIYGVIEFSELSIQ
ncbi:MAG TPA: hypothetical protein VGJ90_04145 [Methylophilaceae bacterium]|jgi:hypothetical protein